MDRSWLEIDWTRHPGEASTRRARAALRFEPVEFSAPALTELLAHLRTMLVNGGALFAMFDVRGVDETAHWYLSHNRFGELGLTWCLLRSPAFAAALPELRGAESTMDEPHHMDVGGREPEGCRRTGAYTLDGEIAALLKFGGAYEAYPGTGAQAKRLGAEVVRELIGDGYDHCWVERWDTPLTPWFHDIAWDCTWFVIDQARQRVSVLCVTEED